MNCPKCSSKYTQDFFIPRILTNCGHTFCEICLTKIHNQYEGKKISCFTCQDVVEIDDITLLTKNLALLNIDNKKNNYICNLHKSTLEAFCFKCKIMLCVSCILSNEHKGHDLFPVNQASKIEKNEFLEKIEKLFLRENEIKEYFSNTSERIDSVKVKIEEGCKIVDDFYKEIFVILEERRTSLLNKINLLYQKEKETKENIKTDLNYYLDFIEKVKIEKNELDFMNEYEILIKSTENIQIVNKILEAKFPDLNNLENENFKFAKIDEIDHLCTLIAKLKKEEVMKDESSLASSIELRREDSIRD